MAETKNTPDQAANEPKPQPGSVIAPGTSPPPPQARPADPVKAPAKPAAPATVASAPRPPAPPAAETPEPPLPPEEIADESAEEEFAELEQDGQGITWTASEFVAHDKSAGWYVSLAIVALIVAALIFLLTRDAVSVAVVVVAGLLLGIYGSHKPRQLEYRLDNRGIGIGQKYYSYDDFRSFSVAPEGAFASIVFMPLKRFALPATIYFAPDDEEKILAVLSDRLPFEEHRVDAVDKLMRRIRF